jgi:hypothetical protein
MLEPTTTTFARTSLAVALIVTGVVATACDRGEQGRARTALTGASTPPPASTGATSRTIDNAGFVDNGGRTSDMTTRTEMSGMTATESGSERPTGTPGSGFPLPEATGARPTIGEGAGAASSENGTSHVPSTGAPLSDAIARIARARCDRETTCNRVGPGRASASQDACVAKQRARAMVDVNPLACPRGVDNVQLGMCLNGLRAQACNDNRGDIGVLPDCLANALCAP